MKISIHARPIEKANVDVLVVNLFAGVTSPHGATGAVDKKLKGLIRHRIKELDFRAEKAGESFLLETHRLMPARYVLVMSLGSRRKFDYEVIRRVAGQSVVEARKIKARTMGTVLHGAGAAGLDPQQCAQSMAEGIFLASYVFDKYKKKEKKKARISEVVVYQRDESQVAVVRRGIKRGKYFSSATARARDLVNEPPQALSPKILVENAQKIAQGPASVSVEVFEREAIKKLGMNAFLGVAQGSDEEPYFVHMMYKHPQAKKRVVLAGKAITFDSGGLSLKPSEAMATMKMDMAGGAAVLGVFSLLTKILPKVEVHGLIASCENMPSGKALKLGDVVRAMNGTTVEVLNTDAEGRLTLADVLSYGAKLKPDAMIDIATLTGAAVVALGDYITALMGNDARLSEDLIKAGGRAGEKIWQLPLEDLYEDHLKSKVADMKNIGKRGSAGTISAGLFLQHFVGNIPWAHLDIAGPAWIEQQDISYLPPGGSGVGVRTMGEFLESMAA